MADLAKTPIFPNAVLLGAGALLAFSIIAAGTARVAERNHVIMPPTEVVASRDLTFTDLSNGGIDITDARTGQLISVVQPQTGGFLRGIMRGLVRDHRLQGQEKGSAFRLTKWADGRLSIEDPATHESFELEAFGRTNEAVFAALLAGQPQINAMTGSDGR